MATGVSGALLDTSILIATDPAGELELPEAAAISVVSVGELRAGVLLTGEASVRAARQGRLAAVRHAFIAIPVDEQVAERYGDVLASARRAKRTEKATDLLIVATAAATGRVLHTLDQRQAGLARHAGVPVVKADS